jgi:hypothetical protein
MSRRNGKPKVWEPTPRIKRMTDAELAAHLRRFGNCVGKYAANEYSMALEEACRREQ